jgi:hypothetical protein
VQKREENSTHRTTRCGTVIAFLSKTKLMQKKHILTGLTGLAVTGFAFYIGKSKMAHNYKDESRNKTVQSKQALSFNGMQKDNTYSYLNDLSVYDDRPE